MNVEHLRLVSVKISQTATGKIALFFNSVCRSVALEITFFVVRCVEQFSFFQSENIGVHVTIAAEQRRRSHTCLTHRTRTRNAKINVFRRVTREKGDKSSKKRLFLQVICQESFFNRTVNRQIRTFVVSAVFTKSFRVKLHTPTLFCKNTCSAIRW